MAKTRRNLYMTDENLDIVKRVMEEQKLVSESATVSFIINEYAKQKTLSEEIVERINKENKAWMERVRWATKTAEVNSQILIDAINTMLLIQGVKYCSHIEYDKSPVIEQSEEKIKERIAHFKQEKDNRKRKE
jgi:hypothetical protein